MQCGLVKHHRASLVCVRFKLSKVPDRCDWHLALAAKR